MNLFKNFNKEVNIQIDTIFKRAKINRIKKYLPSEIKIDLFPMNKKNLGNSMKTK